MSWLADREILYRYKMKDGSIRHVKMSAADDAPKSHTFDDGAVGKYNGFEPEEIKQTHNVEYDQNGRKAMRTRDKNGNITNISQTKLHYMKTGRVEHQYTDEYKQHLMKTNQTQLLQTEHSRKRAKVTQKSFAEIVKDMPDGEYLSDGTNAVAKPK